MDHSKSDIAQFTVSAQFTLANALGIPAVERAQPADANGGSDDK
jgi:hypothetical protein